MRARSGRVLGLMMWSPVVEWWVQPSSRSQHRGSSWRACLARRRHAWVRRSRRPMLTAGRVWRGGVMVGAPLWCRCRALRCFLSGWWGLSPRGDGQLAHVLQRQGAELFVRRGAAARVIRDRVAERVARSTSNRCSPPSAATAVAAQNPGSPSRQRHTARATSMRLARSLIIGTHPGTDGNPKSHT